MNQILSNENNKDKKESYDIDNSKVESLNFDSDPYDEAEEYIEELPYEEADYSNSEYNIQEDYSNNYRNDYSNNYNDYSNNTNPRDSKKIIVIFAIAILIFGLIVCGIVAFKFLNNKKIEDSVPEVSMEEVQEGSVNLSASYKKGIAKLVYFWDENDKVEINSTGESVNKLIDIPKGKNTLTVVLYDKDGNSKEYTKDFVYYTDKEKPTVELAIAEEDASLKITATDETEIAYMKYQWNDDEPITVYPDEEGSKIIEKSIEIQRGKNNLTITVADTSNNIVEEKKAFNGVNEPEIDFYVKNGYLFMIISHDIGLKEVQFKINDEEFTFDESDENYERDKLLLKRVIDLKEGENQIEINAYSVEDTESTKKGKYNYTPEV